MITEKKKPGRKPGIVQKRKAISITLSLEAIRDLHLISGHEKISASGWIEKQITNYRFLENPNAHDEDTF